MESSYSIDSADDLARLKIWGVLTVEGLIELMGQVGSDARFRPGMRVLADFRDARGTWDFSDIQRFRDHVARIAGPIERRWAAVVQPGELVAVGRVTILISEAIGTNIRMQLFDDPRIALRWLRE